MTKNERVEIVIKNLSSLYPKTPIPLDHTNDFTLLVAVLLSAQCTDERVNQVTPELFSLANNPKDMSKVPVNKIKKIIRPCGLSPRKSMSIKKLSDFADLSSDELIGGFDEIKGKKIRIEGYLEEFSLSRKEADDLIMAAREIIYK